MFSKKLAPITLIVMISAILIAVGCGEDSSYDQRAVVYVSNINDGVTYFSDALNQGDSVYAADGVSFHYADDWVSEDVVKVTFQNKPYNSVVDISAGHTDFLVTDYSVEFTTTFSTIPGVTVTVPTFAGKMSTLVPADCGAEAVIPLVPFYTKTIAPLALLHYSADEIMTYAIITFTGHEVQTDNDVSFTAGISVHFADPLVADGDKQ